MQLLSRWWLSWTDNILMQPDNTLGHKRRTRDTPTGYVNSPSDANITQDPKAHQESTFINTMQFLLYPED